MPGGLRGVTGRTIVKFSVLVSLLTGCASKPPTAPGVSVALRYPVLLADDRRLVVKETEDSLTTTSMATGINYPEFTLIDSGGTQYSVKDVTSFGKKSWFLDMGTSQHRVFLQLKKAGTPSLAEAKSLVEGVALRGGLVRDEQAAKAAIAKAGSFPELIAAAGKSWEW